MAKNKNKNKLSPEEIKKRSKNIIKIIENFKIELKELEKKGNKILKNSK